MAVVMIFFRWVWRKFACWVLSWKTRPNSCIPENTESKKQILKRMEKPVHMTEHFKLVEVAKGVPSPKEAKSLKLDECPKMDELFVEEFLEMDGSSRVSEPYVLPSTTDGMVPGPQGRSLLRLPQTAVQSVSTLMVSALQTGWQMCSWKSSASTTSVASRMRTRSPLESPEAELLREVYLVLWAIRKQLRQLARRQERRRRHSRSHTSPQTDPAQGLKQDARSPL
ncbi:uncharacterized protein C7orf61 homolog isoform X1 [Echinops telfairi]|uniref:Uncharacterized protein C7orf61 homolog isoform X1 n=1 Tax=Echinops telfairi TaxID=9371 RepID=A0ABM0IRG7_ECHTE|nr:uncharacterized protein C7orf61 homolog isoform X1 [Echinops telfairi]